MDKTLLMFFLHVSSHYADKWIYFFCRKLRGDCGTQVRYRVGIMKFMLETRQNIEDIVSSGLGEKNHNFVVLDVAGISRFDCAFAQENSPQHCPLVFSLKKNTSIILKKN